MNISVVIPTYNRIETLPRALASIFGQQNIDSEIQVIVVDDGSSDGTEQFVKKHYPQVLYLYQVNKGVSAARNLGLQHADFEWVAFIDSDDEWLPHKLALQVKTLLDSGLKVCHTEEVWLRNGVRVNQMRKHKKHGGMIFLHCLPLCAMSPSSIVIHQSVFAHVGTFDEQLPACEDYDLWLRISANYDVAYIDTPCINKYGGHADQLSRQFWGMDRFRVVALEKILTNAALPLPRDLADAARQMLVTKAQILLNGARKHNNNKLIGDCECLLARWS